MSLEFKQDLSANYGIGETLSPLIRRVLCNNPSPFAYTGTNTYIVGAADGVAVIDPGPLDEPHCEAILKATAPHKIGKILVTHSHIDHSPLAALLSKKTGAPVYAFGPHGAGRKGGLEGETVEAGADWNFMPDIQLKDGAMLEGPDWTIQAIHTPGHTANHMCFHLKEENTLFVGDHVMGWSTTIISPPDGDVRAYIESLRKIAAIDAKTLVPAHGPWINNPGPFIRGIITHRKMREGQILNCIEDGLHVIEEMVDRMYKDIDKRLYPAAARSVLGHIIALHDEGRIRSDGATTLESNYSLPETH